jgi:hypothetical protein
MSQDAIRGILSDYGYFYLGTVVDGARNRGVGAKGMLVSPQFVRHVIYMKDTALLLSIDPDHKLMSSEQLQELASEAIGKDWEVSYHELGDVVTGLLDGDMTYMDWVRLPIIDQPNPAYMGQIFKEFERTLDSCHLALVERLKVCGDRPDWFPLDYRWAQMLAFARTGKIEVNYFTALDHLRERADDYEVYASAMDQIDYRHFSQRIRSIEMKARRCIL